MNTNFHWESIRGVMVSFYEVTGQQIALFNKEGEALIRYPQKWNAVCEAIQATPEGKRRCDACDRSAIRKVARTGEPSINTCHIGFWEICLPIKRSKYDKDVLGYMMLGHLVDAQDDAAQKWRTVCAKCADILPDIEKLRDTFFAIPPVSKDYITALCSMLKGCVSQIILEQYILQTQRSLWEQLKEYIVNHAKDPMTVQSVAAALSVSVSTLTRCAQESAGVTVGKLILWERVKLACDYLQNSEIPVSKVAVQCGIPNYNYFSRLFKHHMGVSPREFRKNTTQP